MKDEFDELLEELNLDDFEVMVNESKDAESMVEYAERYVEEERYGTIVFPDEVKYIEVLVETIVDLEGYNENVGTLFSKIVKVK